MLRRIKIETEVGSIGIWDPELEKNELSDDFEIFEEELKEEANNANLFYFETPSDGDYLTDLYINERPSEEILKYFEPLGREFLIHSNSRKLLISGLEEYSLEDKSASKEQYFEIGTNLAALEVYELDEDAQEGFLKDSVGEGGYAYYEKKSGKGALGCLGVVVAFICLFFKLWTVAAILLGCSVFYLLMVKASQKLDKKFQEIKAKVKEIEGLFPAYVIILRTVKQGENLQGGWVGI